MNAEAKPVKDPEILSVEELKEGQTIRGYVKSVEKRGVFIRSDICFELFNSCLVTCVYMNLQLF